MRVLFVDIDTLRPDHMGCYGYHRNTTPNFDQIAKEGVMFDNYYCSDAPCLPSRAALISGMFGIHNGAVGHGGTTGDRMLDGRDRGFVSEIDTNNFNYIFRKAGLRTTSISTFPERHSSWWFNSGFHEIYNVGKRGDERGDEVLPVALDWIERKGAQDNWFLHLHLWDPHTPYRTPMEYGNPFEHDPLPKWITEDVLNQHLKHVGPHSINEISMYDDWENPAFPRQPGKASDMEGLRKVIDGYDTGIWYADHVLGQVFDLLKEKGIYEETAVIITSDHGENFGELGIYAEHGTADHATCRIPMIIKWPGGKKNYVDKGLHYNIDLCPTMADLFKVQPYKKWDGKSYADTIVAGEDRGQEFLVLSQMAHVCQRAVRFEDWIYIRTYHDGYHLFDKEMLFSLKDDPYEEHNLAASRQDICDKAARILLNWHDEMLLSADHKVDPLWTVIEEGGPFHAKGNLDKYLIRLRNTGRSEGADQLEKKYK
ncbi:MAG: sulfatase [Herbinix sp.]|jgi:arylsulfatase A-like enzyme|nr:sulfatase [Herbinix sp.]